MWSEITLVAERFRGRGGTVVRWYENSLSTEFSAYKVTSSPPELGGEIDTLRADYSAAEESYIFAF